MPTRHISSQSFNEILSELGDDPAIPDPQGIRKPSSPQDPFSGTSTQTHSRPKLSQLPHPLDALSELKKSGLLIGLGICAIGLGAAAWLVFDPAKTGSHSDIESVQAEIKGLQKELANLQNDLLDIEDTLYQSIDSIEVSIHLLEKTKPINMAKPKVQTIPFEAEIRKWRYLGSSQMAGSHQAFFHNGVRGVMLEKGALVLGEWRLNSINKGLASITHPLGQSIVLQTSKAE